MNTLVGFRSTQNPVIPAAAMLVVVYAAMVWFAWVGYVGSDDWVYIQNARQRITDPFLVGRNHWEVRLTLTLPMAATFALFGESEIAAALPTLAYLLGTVAAVFVFFARRHGAGVGLLIATLVATHPLLLVNATALRVDAAETFFVVMSLLALYSAFDEGRRARSLFAVAGVFAGLAFVTRPTSVSLLVFFGGLFLVGYRAPRARYLWIGGGFALIWLSESLYFLAATGKFLYRLTIDYSHDQVLRSGSLLQAVLVEPAKMLLSSHSLGLTFLLLPIASLSLGRAKSVPRNVRTSTVFFAVFAVTWVTVFSGFARKLVLDPRYLAPAATGALIVIGFWVVWIAKRGRKLAAAAIAAIVFATHGLAIYLENKDFLYSPRWLTGLAVRYGERIYTDPQTYERALFLLELAGVKGKVVPEPAPAGALFLAVPENAARGTYNAFRWNPSDYAPGDWPIVERLEPGRKKIGELIESFGLSSRFPPSLWQKLNNPNPPVVLYRRP